MSRITTWTSASKQIDAFSTCNKTENRESDLSAANSVQSRATALGQQLDRLHDRNMQLRREIYEETEKGERLVLDILNMKKLKLLFMQELAEVNLSWEERMRINDPATRPQRPLPPIGRPNKNHL